MNNSLSLFVKEMRKRFGLTQVDLAAKAGVGLRFVRELEQGKQTLRLLLSNFLHLKSANIKTVSSISSLINSDFLNSPNWN